MRRFFSSLLLATLLGSAQAADAPPAAPEATPAIAPASPPAAEPAATPEAKPVATPEAKPAAAPALEPIPDRRGYAVGQPEILLRQRLFGRAHGLSLLTAACVRLPAYTASIQDTYATWYAKQAKAIETIVRDLAAYYFGPRAGEARWSDLSHALNLPDSIEPALGEVTLHAACASLPEAMPRPRYEFDKFLAGTIELEPLPADYTAAPPAPTPQKPGE